MNKILIIDPNKMDGVKLNEFDNSIVTSKEKQKKQAIMSEKEYQELQRRSNEIEQELVNEQDGKVTEICYISGVKDIKQCTLSFETNNKNISK